MDERAERLLRCPRCHSALTRGTVWLCENSTCEYSRSGFPTLAGAPILIDFADSIFDRAGLTQSVDPSQVERSTSIFRRLREWASGRNDAAAGNCETFVERCRTFAEPMVLVIGGGARGSGTEALYAARDICLVGTDVYKSPNVQILVDGHRLPFADQSFHGVWIQAVLEHVLEPQRVVEEIHRVLVKDGLVYAETPFMQPVHERAYDFTRFTRSGHRWLFRRFTELSSGTIGGPGASLAWSLRYMARGLFRNDKVASLFTLAFFWLQYLDRFVDERHRADAATGNFFLGAKAEEDIKPRSMIAYFPGVRAPERRGESK